MNVPNSKGDQAQFCARLAALTESRASVSVDRCPEKLIAGLFAVGLSRSLILSYKRAANGVRCNPDRPWIRDRSQARIYSRHRTDRDFFWYGTSSG